MALQTLNILAVAETASTESSSQTLTIIFTVLYLFVMSFMAYKGYRATKDSDDYLLAGRQIHPLVMALSYGAAFISTSAIVGFGGAAGVLGCSTLWLTVLNISLGVFIAFLVFGKRTRQIGHNIQAHTFPEFLSIRYQSKFIKKFSAMIIFIFMPLYAAAVMIGVMKVLAGVFEMNEVAALFITAVLVAIYVFFGGLKGVMYADAFQGGLMFIGMAFLICFVYAQLGGVTEAYTKLGALFDNEAVKAQLGKFPPGFRGWTAMPEFLSINWLVVITTITLGVGIGVLAQPQLAVKFMTVKSNRELNRAIPTGALFVIMMTGVAFTVGALSNVFFFESTGKIAVAAAKGADNIIPLFMKSFMPAWFTALFMVVLIAAGMSTMSSQFHAVAAAFGRDILGSKNDTPQQQMFKNRFGVLVAFLISLLLAWWLPKVWSDAISIATTLFFGLCAASFLPMYFAGLFCRRITRSAAIFGMIGGFIISLFWMAFIFKKTSSVLTICEKISGKISLVAGTNAMKLMFLDPIVVALASSIVITVIINAISKQDIEEAHIKKCFSGIR